VTRLSSSDEWSTPDDLYRALNAKYNFNVDLAATHENAKTTVFLAKDTNDALDTDWLRYGKRGWLNPPYSRPNIPAFLTRARMFAPMGFTTVLLLPANTSESYFHDTIVHGCETVGGELIVAGPLAGWGARLSANDCRVWLHFLNGRLHFDHEGDEVTGSKKGSMLVAFSPPWR